MGAITCPCVVRVVFVAYKVWYRQVGSVLVHNLVHPVASGDVQHMQHDGCHGDSIVLIRLNKGYKHNSSCGTNDKVVTVTIFRFQNCTMPRSCFAIFF